MEQIKRLTLLLEFGIPHYRYFLFDDLKSKYSNFLIVHNGERFKGTDRYSNSKGINFRLPFDISITLIDPLPLFRSDIIITTFNLRKPHTWIFCLIMPWKKWIFWGKGIGKGKSFLLHSLRRVLFNVSSGFVVYTEEGRNDLIQLGYRREKITVAYNTLRVDNHMRCTGDAYFIFVGRLQRRKNIPHVLEVLKFLEAKLVIVGDGEEGPNLKRMVQEAGLEDKVTFVGAVYDQDQLKGYFEKAIGYVSPGAVGLGVVHSFAYGVPVLTSTKDKEHGPEFKYCNNENSFIYEDNLMDAMNSAMNNRELREDKSRNAYSFYKKYLSYENVIAAFDQQIEK